MTFLRQFIEDLMALAAITFVMLIVTGLLSGYAQLMWEGVR